LLVISLLLQYSIANSSKPTHRVITSADSIWGGEDPLPIHSVQFKLGDNSIYLFQPAAEVVIINIWD
jgi:hypothetical protein